MRNIALPRRWSEIPAYMWATRSTGFTVLLTILAMKAVALAQQPDPAKLAPVYRQQRDIANDQIAVCAASAADLQARIAELEKKLAEAAAAKASQ